MCQWDKRLHAANSAELVCAWKNIGFLTNSWCFNRALVVSIPSICGNTSVGTDTECFFVTGRNSCQFTPCKMVAAILKALRAPLKEDGHVSSVDEVAGPAPETLVDYAEVWGRRQWRLLEDVVLTVRSERHCLDAL